MDGYCSSDSPSFEQDQDQVRVPSPTGDTKPTHPLPSPSDDSSPPAKRSRRSVQKRVVSVPFLDSDGSRPKGVSECTPPSDSWAWRKYGQKPIKGSPYPRGYYRCSSSKGCPARKQVERSRTDPTMLLITYSFDHNHPWPLPKHHSHPNSHKTRPAELRPKQAQPDPAPPVDRADRPAEPEEKSSDEKFSDLVTVKDDDFYWFSDSPPGAEESLLYGPIFGAIDASALVVPESRVGSGEGEDDPLFAELGELPECAFVFRSNTFSFTSETPWCGTTG